MTTDAFYQGIVDRMFEWIDDGTLSVHRRTDNGGITVNWTAVGGGSAYMFDPDGHILSRTSQYKPWRDTGRYLTQEEYDRLEAMIQD